MEVGPAIDKIKPTLLDYVDRRIDGIPEADPGPAECNPGTVKSVGVKIGVQEFVGNIVPNQRTQQAIDDSPIRGDSDLGYRHFRWTPPDVGWD